MKWSKKAKKEIDNYQGMLDERHESSKKLKIARDAMYQATGDFLASERWFSNELKRSDISLLKKYGYDYLARDAEG